MLQKQIVLLTALWKAGDEALCPCAGPAASGQGGSAQGFGPAADAVGSSLSVVGPRLQNESSDMPRSLSLDDPLSMPDLAPLPLAERQHEGCEQPGHDRQQAESAGSHSRDRLGDWQPAHPTPRSPFEPSEHGGDQPPLPIDSQSSGAEQMDPEEEVPGPPPGSPPGPPQSSLTSAGHQLLSSSSTGVVQTHAAVARGMPSSTSMHAADGDYPAPLPVQVCP